MDDLRERRVAHALADVASGRVGGMENLFDLLGDSVYRLTKALTGDASTAEHATVETFTQIWARAPRHLAKGAATSWVLALACDVVCAKRISVGQGQ